VKIGVIRVSPSFFIVFIKKWQKAVFPKAGNRGRWTFLIKREPGRALKTFGRLNAIAGKGPADFSGRNGSPEEASQKLGRLPRFPGMHRFDKQMFIDFLVIFHGLKPGRPPQRLGPCSIGGIFRLSKCFLPQGLQKTVN
jgi:hypothetical protein